MKSAEIAKRIEELEKRVRALESKPISMPGSYYPRPQTVVTVFTGQPPDSAAPEGAADQPTVTKESK